MTSSRSFYDVIRRNVTSARLSWINATSARFTSDVIVEKSPTQEKFGRRILSLSADDDPTLFTSLALLEDDGVGAAAGGTVNCSVGGANDKRCSSEAMAVDNWSKKEAVVDDWSRFCTTKGWAKKRGGAKLGAWSMNKGAWLERFCDITPPKIELQKLTKLTHSHIRFTTGVYRFGHGIGHKIWRKIQQNLNFLRYGREMKSYSTPYSIPKL
uniref:Uncharacterized protein n=1 Tax=Romanomermis culicivorax TaxID=13658 RepID=A0A915JA54_ROMCU